MDRFSLILTLVIVGSATALGGCANQSTYSWSHAASGEYLFAFDSRECDAASERAASSDRDVLDAFMACMTDRGYYLVDPATGDPLVADADTRRPAAVGVEARN